MKPPVKPASLRHQIEFPGWIPVLIYVPVLVGNSMFIIFVDRGGALLDALAWSALVGVLSVLLFALVWWQTRKSSYVEVGAGYIDLPGGMWRQRRRYSRHEVSAFYFERNGLKKGVERWRVHFLPRVSQRPLYYDGWVIDELVYAQTYFVTGGDLKDDLTALDYPVRVRPRRNWWGQVVEEADQTVGTTDL